MAHSTRRTFLKVSAASGAALVLSPLLEACGSPEEQLGLLRAAGEGDDPQISSKYFYVEVKGVYDKVPGVISMDPGAVRITVEECTQGDQPEYREYSYGSHEYGDLTMTVQAGPGMVKLQEWADKAIKVGGGDALRRDISLYLLGRDRSTVLRTVTAFGCYPVSVRANGRRDIKSITFTCNVDRIEETKG